MQGHPARGEAEHDAQHELHRGIHERKEAVGEGVPPFLIVQIKGQGILNIPENENGKRQNRDAVRVGLVFELKLEGVHGNRLGRWYKFGF